MVFDGQSPHTRSTFPAANAIRATPYMTKLLPVPVARSTEHASLSGNSIILAMHRSPGTSAEAFGSRPVVFGQLTRVGVGFAEEEVTDSPNCFSLILSSLTESVKESFVLPDVELRGIYASAGARPDCSFLN